MSNEISEAARRYAELGLAVIPLRRETNTPTIRYKQIERDGGMSAGELRRHFPDDRRNIGLLSGSASRFLMALYLDTYGAYKNFASRFPKLCKTLPYAISPCGWHFYFLAPDGERRTRTYHVGRQTRSPVCHIKGDGNYITLTPSWRADADAKKEYRWVRDLLSSLGSLPTVQPRTLLPHSQVEVHLPQAARFHPITPPLVGGGLGREVGSPHTLQRIVTNPGGLFTG